MLMIWKNIYRSDIQDIFLRSPSKTVPGKFDGSGGHNNCNCLQERVSFHKLEHGKFS